MSPAPPTGMHGGARNPQMAMPPSFYACGMQQQQMCATSYGMPQQMQRHVSPYAGLPPAGCFAGNGQCMPSTQLAACQPPFSSRPDAPSGARPPTAGGSGPHQQQQAPAHYGQPLPQQLPQSSGGYMQHGALAILQQQQWQQQQRVPPAQGCASSMQRYGSQLQANPVAGSPRPAPLALSQPHILYPNHLHKDDTLRALQQLRCNFYELALHITLEDVSVLEGGISSFLGCVPVRVGSKLLVGFIAVPMLGTFELQQTLCVIMEALNPLTLEQNSTALVCLMQGLVALCNRTMFPRLEHLRAILHAKKDLLLMALAHLTTLAFKFTDEVAPRGRGHPDHRRAAAPTGHGRCALKPFSVQGLPEAPAIQQPAGTHAGQARAAQGL
ncbi:hypothetical protein T492DRAFT_9097 [Pavlovales sp. CCMP2436]|nr:hypothetical protein T492DRAFT_9097 [Pavlovales sp. CCMP2436]